MRLDNGAGLIVEVAAVVIVPGREEPSLGRALAESGFRLLASRYGIEQIQANMLGR